MGGDGGDDVGGGDGGGGGGGGGGGTGGGGGDDERGGSGIVLHSFEGDLEQAQVTVAAGDVVQLLNTNLADGWLWVLTSDGTEGYLPSSYIE